MLSRSSSDAAIGLRRQKSTSSVQRTSNGIPIEHVDPELAQQQAHAAALAAYEQVHGQTNNTYLENLARQRARRNKSSEGTHLLAHRESTKRLGGASKRGMVESQTISRTRQPIKTGSSAASSIGVHPSKHTVDPTADSLVHSELLNSMPVTPQRGVRKAHSSVDFSDASATAHRQQRLQAYVETQRAVDYESHDHPPTRPAECDPIQDQKDSFKRVFSSFIGQTSKPPEQGPTSSNEQIIRKRTSFISVPLSRRGRTSVHEPIQTTTTSITTHGNRNSSTTRVSTQSHLPSYSMPPVPKNRSVSSTLKARLARFFRKVSEPKEPLLLPQQQVTASRSHYSSTWETPPLAYGSPGLDRASSAQPVGDIVRSRTPSADLARTSINIPSRPREVSGGSQKTIAQTGSRVTSWTDSTVTKGIDDNNREVLLVIDEFAYEKPDASNKGRTNQHDSQAASPATSLLGRRIYEKLMRRQTEADAAAEYEQLIDAVDPFQPEIRKADPTFQPHPVSAPTEAAKSALNPAPRPRKSSWGLRAAREAALSTIRAVTPSIGTSRKVSDGRDDPDFNNEDITVPIESIPASKTSPSWAKNGSRPSEEQIAKRISKSENRWKGPLEAGAAPYAPISALDFASATAYISPDVDAVKQASSSKPPAHKGSVTEDVAGFVFSHKAKPSSHGDGHGAVSPSVYSRATDDSPAKTLPSDSPRENDSGSAVVLSSYRISTGSPEKRRLQHRATHSTRSSKDWRAWLSEEFGDWDKDNVSDDKLAFTSSLISVTEELKEDTSSLSSREDEVNPDATSRSAPTEHDKASGHHREYAQILDDTPTNVVLNMYTGESSMTLSASGSGAATRRAGESGDSLQFDEDKPSPTERPASVMNDRFPMLDTGRRSSWHRPPSSVSGRPPTPSPQSANPYQENAKIRDDGRAVSRASVGNLLTVPQNPLLVSRSRSMIPLRARGTTGTNYRNTGVTSPIQRSLSPYAPPVQSRDDGINAPLRPASTTPTIALPSPSPSKSSSRLSVIPQIRQASPFAAASSSPRHTPTTRHLHSREINSDSTPRYVRPDSVASLRRKPVPRGPELLDDTTIKRIYDGPYADANKDATYSHGKENVAMSTPRVLTVKRSFGTSLSNSPSGGQRLADEWLKTRAVGDSQGTTAGDGGMWKSDMTESPAFI